jgi:hypothetical protein
MNIAEVRKQAAAVVNAMADPLTCFAYVPSDGPTPFAYFQVESVEYDRAMRQGSEELILTLMVMVSRADDRTSSELLDAYISSTGSKSLKAAIEAANGAPGQLALSGQADFVHVSGTTSGPRWYEWEDGSKYYGAGLRVRVLGTGG